MMLAIDGVGYSFNTLSIPYFLSFFISIAVACILFAKKRDDRHVQLFIVVQVLLAVLSFAAAMATSSLEPGHWKIWYSLNSIASVLVVTTFFHFSYVSLANKGVLENKKILLVYIVPLFFLVFLIDPNSLVEVIAYSHLGIYHILYSGLFSLYGPLFTITLTLFLVLTTINFIRMYRSSKKTVLKRKALFFILSSFTPLFGLMLSMILETFNILLSVNLGMLCISISGVIIAYGILKFRLFDIEFIVKKTFTYLIITVALFGVFKIIEVASSYLLSFNVLSGDIMSRLISTIIVAGVFFPVRGLALNIGNSIFPKVSKPIQFDDNKALSLYNKQLKLALADGKLNSKEEKMLKALRTELQITDDVHIKMKRKIIEKLK